MVYIGVGLQTSEKMIIQQAARVPPIVPLITSLPDGREVVVDFMTESQLSATFAMIQEAAKNSNGFGITEFSSEKVFRREIEGGYSFAITRKDSGELIAGFIIAISKFYRGTKVADPFIIVKKSERRKGVGDFCLRTAVNFAADLEFIAMYVDCFSNNKGMTRIIEKHGGFARCGFLPMGGQLSDGTYVGSIIFYKDLRREE
ncbi:hypothetical protein SNE40_021692 [Patella caerulea]|uniref:N-acetyltransferase domain-containing protein n=1 Tax=Patella caerulea TaxID=87958 RepID=A0AAN8IX26_PATCE